MKACGRSLWLKERNLMSLAWGDQLKDRLTLDDETMKVRELKCIPVFRKSCAENGKEHYKLEPADSWDMILKVGISVEVKNKFRGNSILFSRSLFYSSSVVNLLGFRPTRILTHCWLHKFNWAVEVKTAHLIFHARLRGFPLGGCWNKQNFQSLGKFCQVWFSEIIRHKLRDYSYVKVIPCDVQESFVLEMVSECGSRPESDE